MATSVIMPALEMAQESGVLVAWLKHDGEAVSKGEPIMEIETDKVTVEIEAPASGRLGGILAQEGDVVPVGRTIAWILASGEDAPPVQPSSAQPVAADTIKVSPVARKYAEQNGIDLTDVQPAGKRIAKADVLAYVDAERQAKAAVGAGLSVVPISTRLTPASPKARRLVRERGADITNLQGSGPGGAILAADVPLSVGNNGSGPTAEALSGPWRAMAEHMSASWTGVPHFYLSREVFAGNLLEWRSHITHKVEKTCGIKVSLTDLLVKLTGVALRAHPRVNAAWEQGRIRLNTEVNVGIAVAVEEGLIVPVIRGAENASISDIAAQRNDLVERAKARKLRPADVSGGTFTISNLGMYNVDAFQAIVNAPQAAILAVGRVMERVVSLNGQPVIRPMVSLCLSCDHRVVDGARAAQFLDELANLIADPLLLLS